MLVCGLGLLELLLFLKCYWVYGGCYIWWVLLCCLAFWWLNLANCLLCFRGLTLCWLNCCFGFVWLAVVRFCCLVFGVLFYWLRCLVGFTFVLFVGLLLICLFVVLGLFCCWRADEFVGCVCGFVYMDCCLFVVFGFSLLVIVWFSVYMVWYCYLPLFIWFAVVFCWRWCLLVCFVLFWCFPRLEFLVNCLWHIVSCCWFLFGLIV